MEARKSVSEFIIILNEKLNPDSILLTGSFVLYRANEIKTGVYDCLLSTLFKVNQTVFILYIYGQMKNRTGFFLLSIFVIGISGCTKEDQIPSKKDEQTKDPIADHLPVITDTHINILNPVTAIAGFDISDDGGAPILEHGVCWSTLRYPTTNCQKILENGEFSKNQIYYLTGLKSSTTYFIRAFAANDLGTGYGDQQSFTTPDLNYDSPSDIDGNLYKTVQIGSQVWMAENLKTTRYNDGTVIPEIQDNSVWLTLLIGGRRWYGNDATTYKDLYGAMYNWNAVNTKKLCPAGWHVPSDDEWKKLEIELGMTPEEADSWGSDEFPMLISRGTDQGTQLKATSGWTNWEGKDGNGTNTSGFSALPGGDTGWFGEFDLAGQCGTWWSSTEFNPANWNETSSAIARALGSGDEGVIRAAYYKHTGFSVRCLRDQ